jgi:predicted nucleic acid-binding protein
LPPEQIILALRALAGLPGVSVDDAALVAKALDWAEAGMDFADAIHLAAAAQCEGFLSFDKRFARSGTRLSGIPIRAP